MNNTNDTTDITSVLRRAQIGYSGHAHAWIRLKGEGLDAISIHAQSGGWRDHRNGEHGNFRALAEKLKLEVSDFYLSAAPAHPVEPQDAEAASKRRKQQWARTQWARGVSAVKPPRPHGWSQAAWDKDQKKYQDCRDAIYDYLLSRGLDPLPLLPMIRFSTKFHSELDMEMRDQGADFWFMIPMYEIGKPQIPGNICGVQRTYLTFASDKYHPVEKIGRAMLGTKGVTELLPMPTSNPISLPNVQNHQVLGIGEGFETVASFVQVVGHGGIICWDWSGLKLWTSMTIPRENTPVIAFLVDRDKSETGQRESAAGVRRITAQEHGQAVYLLPPACIQPDAKGNRDWNDLLRQSPDEFAAEIVRAWHKSDENLALAPSPRNGEVVAVTDGQGPSDAEVAQTIAEAVARHAAGEALKLGIAEYESAYEKYRELMVQWSGMEPEERKEKHFKKPVQPPLLIKVTTGVGKSHQIRELIQSTELPLLILTRTHDLAKEYEAAGAFRYHGRSEPAIPAPADRYTMGFVRENHGDFKASDCFKYSVVQITSENNHVPALTACRECEHGRKFIIDNYHEKSEPYKDAVQWFSRNPVSPENVPACLWLSHQMRASHARIVVAPAASFSDSLATWQTEDGAVPRLIIVDEMPDLAREIRAHSGDIGLAVANAQKAIEYIKAHADDEKPGGLLAAVENAGGKPDAEALIADLHAAIDLFGDVAAWLGGAMDKGIQSVPDEICIKVDALHVDWLPGATARWEKAEIRYGREPFVPLRMAKAMIESIQTRTALAEKGILHIRETTKLGEHILHGKPCILLDATPSRAVETIVTAKNGQIVHAIAKQHINLVHYHQFLHGRTWKTKEHQRDELARLMTLREQMSAETGNTPNVLTYMPHCTLAGTQEDAAWGYFGRDDVGQDRWKAQDLLIYGGPLFSPTTQAVTYNTELMLMRLAGMENLPDWSCEIERRQEITVGDKRVESKAPLPTDTYLRDWVLGDYGRRIAQAIGRVRGVWASADKPINVWIAGGLPLAGLAEHGITVNEYRQEKLIDLRDEKHREAIEKVQVAVAALQAADADTSYRAVNQWLADHQLPGVRHAVWQEVVKALTGLNKDTYEPVNAILASLHSLQKVADWQGSDLSDVALNTWNAPSVDPEVRAAAEIVLEVSPYAEKWRQVHRDG